MSEFAVKPFPLLVNKRLKLSSDYLLKQMSLEGLKKMKYPPPFKLFKIKHGQTNVNNSSIAIYPGKTMGVVHVKSPSKKGRKCCVLIMLPFSDLKMSYLPLRETVSFHVTVTLLATC